MSGQWATKEKNMERRVLGSTGISVSGFALGTMMLGAQGITDHTSRSA
jgi:aryl-alcohol dehydrogenase-like predicted oxidoreductase